MSDTSRKPSSRKPQPKDCICEPPVRNDIAWHVSTCPWRIRRLAENREKWG